MDSAAPSPIPSQPLFADASGAITNSVFQNFAPQTTPHTVAPRVKLLRAALKKHKLDGYLIPRADCFQNEYIRDCDARLAFVTSFTGSAGLAAVLKTKAFIYVDGRYHEQVRRESDMAAFAPLDVGENPPEAHLAQTLKRNAVVGYDPWLFTKAHITRFEKAFARKAITLKALERNLVDAIWQDRPAQARATARRHLAHLAGATVEQKLAAVRAQLTEHDACDGLVVSDPHSLCWLFNLRGDEIAHTPVILGFALVPKSGKPTLYADFAKFPETLRADIAADVLVKPEETLVPDLKKLGKGKKTLVFDAATAPVHLVRVFEKAGGAAHVTADPAAALKARKNTAELQGMEEAHRYDGAALVTFLCTLEEALDAAVPLTEIAACRALERARLNTGHLKDLSFPAIAGAGANAALPHYHPTTLSNAPLEPGIFLLDSGGQYDCGTTDITRTLLIGTPPAAELAAMRAAYTRVLIGHIRLAKAVFPAETTGAQLDSLARAALWQAGLDFNHGTGHGVGACLSVHEGPQRISKTSMVALEPGMIVSNEPGFYLPGAFGIRIENLLVVRPCKSDRATAGDALLAKAQKEMLCFDTISLAPIDTRLIDKSLMQDDEIAWLNAYHARVRDTLSPMLEAKAQAWLERATAPI